MSMNQLQRKAVQQRQVDLLLLQIDKRNADLIAERTQGQLFADQTQVDGRHIEPRGVWPVDTQLVQLLRR